MSEIRALNVFVATGGTGSGSSHWAIGGLAAAAEISPNANTRPSATARSQRWSGLPTAGVLLTLHGLVLSRNVFVTNLSNPMGSGVPAGMEAYATGAKPLSRDPTYKLEAEYSPSAHPRRCGDSIVLSRLSAPPAAMTRRSNTRTPLRSGSRPCITLPGVQSARYEEPKA